MSSNDKTCSECINNNGGLCISESVAEQGLPVEEQRSFSKLQLLWYNGCGKAARYFEAILPDGLVIHKASNGNYKEEHKLLCDITGYRAKFFDFKAYKTREKIYWWTIDSDHITDCISTEEEIYEALKDPRVRCGTDY